MKVYNRMERAFLECFIKLLSAIDKRALINALIDTTYLPDYVSALFEILGIKERKKEPIIDVGGKSCQVERISIMRRL